MPTTTIFLCPVCGERLTVESKTNAAGDPIARRACTVSLDYTEPWQHRPVTAAVGRVGLRAGAVVTASGEPRQAPLVVRAPKVVQRAVRDDR